MCRIYWPRWRFSTSAVPVALLLRIADLFERFFLFVAAGRWRCAARRWKSSSTLARLMTSPERSPPRNWWPSEWRHSRRHGDGVYKGGHVYISTDPDVGPQGGWGARHDDCEIRPRTWSRRIGLLLMFKFPTKRRVRSFILFFFSLLYFLCLFSLVRFLIYAVRARSVTKEFLHAAAVSGRPLRGVCALCCSFFFAFLFKRTTVGPLLYRQQSVRDCAAFYIYCEIATFAFCVKGRKDLWKVSNMFEIFFPPLALLLSFPAFAFSFVFCCQAMRLLRHWWRNAPWRIIVQWRHCLVVNMYRCVGGTAGTVVQ